MLRQGQDRRREARLRGAFRQRQYSARCAEPRGYLRHGEEPRHAVRRTRIRDVAFKLACADAAGEAQAHLRRVQRAGPSPRRIQRRQARKGRLLPARGGARHEELRRPCGTAEVRKARPRQPGADPVP